MPSAVYLAGARGPNSCQWWQANAFTNETGQVLWTTNRSYLELGNSLNFLSSGKWLPSKDEIDPYPGGAAATNAPSLLVAANNANSSTATSLSLPDGGGVLNSHVVGLSYYEPATGSNVWIAETKDCQGVILLPNRVLWDDAFSADFKAGILGVFTRQGYEQNIIIEQQLTPPSTFGLGSSCLLQVWTEFVSPPKPVVTETAVPFGSDSLADQELRFGAMKIGPGKAFIIGQDPLDGVPVTKEWVTTPDQRVFLVESVRLSDIAGQLSQLPTSQQASVRPLPGSIRNIASLKRLLPPRRTASTTTSEMKIAEHVSVPKGLVMDYSILNTGGLTNQVFQCDTTYYLSTGPVTLYGTNDVFEGGTVLKFASNVTLAVNAPVTWLGANYRPILMLAKDDNSAGQSISGSTGSPGTNGYASQALYFNSVAAGTNLVLQNLRIANAQTAIAINGGSNHELSNVQLVNCGIGVAATNATFALYNALDYEVLTNFVGNGSTGDVEQVTIDAANWLNPNNLNLCLTNCLLCAVANPGTFTSNSVSSVSSSSGIFQTVGSGGHYLAADSPYRNAGTTSINSGLATALAKLTTYPPVALDSNLTFSVALSPQAQRDSDLPDIGWHYYPLDYLWTNLTVNSGVTLSLNNGVAIGVCGANGMTVNDTLTSQGTPVNLNYLAPIAGVQEFGSTALTNLISGNGAWVGLSLRFTDLPTFGGGTYYLQASDSGLTILNSGPIALEDCQMHGGQMYIALGGNSSGNSSITVSLTNNLMERCAITFFRGLNTFSSIPSKLVINEYNNLFRGGALHLWYIITSADPLPPHNGLPPTWRTYDNLFDSITLDQQCSDNGGGTIWPSFFLDAHNGYFSATALSNSSGGDKTLGAADYQVGPLGNYYYPTTGTNLAALINAGSRLASAAGLYHYTTQTNQAVEGSTTVDTGFHWVALNAAGLPLDTNGDGIPDYLEDANGNGVVDSGEIGWNLTGDLGLKVLITRPRNGSTLP